MSKKTANYRDITAVVNSVLESYSNNIKDGIIEIVEKLSKDGKNELRKKSPRRTGDYYRGWRIKTDKGSTFIHCTIYNATNYQLTHLLEKGHRIVRNSKHVGQAKAIPHISNVQDRINDEFLKRTSEMIKRGGN